MTLRRLIALLVVLVLASPWCVRPGPAQAQLSGRYAFADTTLLRDTLDLHFDNLFPLADSIGILPDTLRALSIRYEYPLERLVHLSDSLKVPVDSVGSYMLRRSFSPLAAGERESDFHYDSGYNVQQTSSNWTNSSNYNYVVGPFFLRNTTSINFDRFRFGGRKPSLRQTRNASTETGWRFSPDFSVGGRLILDRFNSFGSTLRNEGETKNEYQLSLRGHVEPSQGLTSDLSFFTGLLDLTGTRQEKRGVTSEMQTDLQYTRGSWLTHSFSSQVSGNLARTRTPGQLARINTSDYSTNFNGTLFLFNSTPTAINLDGGIQRSRVQTPASSGQIEDVLTGNSRANLTLRLRKDNDRNVDIKQSFDNSQQTSAQSLSSQSTRGSGTFSVNGNYLLVGWYMTGNFSLNQTTSRFPNRDQTGGYAERSAANTIGGNATRAVGARITLKVTGSATLNTYRYDQIGAYASIPVTRDQYRQSYRVDGSFARDQRSNTGLALEVSRNLAINIPSAAAASNNEIRSYRAEWRWSYRLFQGLTATQNNQLNADYVYYTFLHANDRLSLDYSTFTTLSAVVTPRLRIELNHNARIQPGGGYAPLTPGGLPYFSQSDETKNYRLASTVDYTPSPKISLNLQTEYRATDRRDGDDVPQRASKNLTFSGGARLNFPLGTKGRLTGDIRRSYIADRSTTFQLGVPQPSPRSESDYWNGRLGLSWDL